MGKGKDSCNALGGAAIYKKAAQDIAVGDVVILRIRAPAMHVLEVMCRQVVVSSCDDRKK